MAECLCKIYVPLRTVPSGTRGGKMNRRVVITGLGAISPIGNNVEEMWKGIENKKCGIDKITLFDASDYKTS